MRGIRKVAAFIWFVPVVQHQCRRGPLMLSTRKERRQLSKDSGAIDLASIMIGVLVMAIIGGVIAAAVFVVIPWAQNSAAKDALSSVKTAQGVAQLKHNAYLDSDELVTKNLIQSSGRIAIDTNPLGTCFIAVSASQTGDTYFTSDYSPAVQSTVNARVPGLTGRYYNGTAFAGTPFQSNDSVVDFDWGRGSPDSSIGDDQFSIRWTGYLTAPETGNYSIRTSTDDGVRLWVDGVELITKWIPQSPTYWTGTISLTAGQTVPLTMEYYEQGGGALARLAWAQPSAPTTFNIIPASAMSTEPGCVTAAEFGALIASSLD
jgi:type II secretory pathway pseudopilin PulG